MNWRPRPSGSACRAAAISRRTRWRPRPLHCGACAPKITPDNAYVAGRHDRHSVGRTPPRLGTFVMEDVRLDSGAELDVLERADEMGRQLSAATRTCCCWTTSFDRAAADARSLAGRSCGGMQSERRVVCESGVQHTHRNPVRTPDRPMDELVPPTRGITGAPVAPRRTAGSFAPRWKTLLKGRFLMTVTP
jgi:hypothetical protein